jgi:Protein of unknown function, DUF488
LQEFVDLLNGEQIALLVDVRGIPRSRTNPQFKFKRNAWFEATVLPTLRERAAGALADREL